MLTDKKLSIKNIIAKVYLDLDLNDEVDIGRLIEWSAEALEKINVYQQLNDKDDCIKIDNYKAEIPCDLVYLTDVNYMGAQLDKAPSDNITFKRRYPYYVTPRAVNQDKLENAPYWYAKLYIFPNKETFIMENGWFKTSFKEGKIDIKYKALPMDDEGYPLVPDHVSFREALYWYIVYKTMYIKALKDDKYKWFYQDAETKYRYYVNQAGAEAMMPDVFTLENIKRNYLRLVPKINDYREFFRGLNSVNG